MAKPISERADLLPLISEVFRSHGYEGATLALIGKATGLGKGSLYHFFPDGKAQMAAEVLAEIDHWFEVNIFAALRKSGDPARAIAEMTDGVDRYFHSGHRVCLVGVIALGASRDIFARQVQDANAAACRAQCKRGATAIRGRAIDHPGRAGAGARARRHKSVRAGDGRYEGAAAREVRLVRSPDAAQRH
jgi:TetR/AcrR family transcriptional repressor of lmrAB and yxaGH operons